MKETQEYTMIVRNSNGDALCTFESNQYQEALKWMESGPFVISAYRIQLVPKGKITK